MAHKMAVLSSGSALTDHTITDCHDYGSSESQVVLQRNDICRFIADGELISKICFYQNLSMAFFQKLRFCIRHIIYFVTGLVGPSVKSQPDFFDSYCIVNKERTISIAKISAK